MNECCCAATQEMLTSNSARRRKLAPSGDDDPNKLYCVCRQPAKPDSKEVWVACDVCEQWFHPRCVGMDDDAAAKLAVFKCDACHAKPQPKKPVKSRPSRRHKFAPGHYKVSVKLEGEVVCTATATIGAAKLRQMTPVVGARRSSRVSIKTHVESSGGSCDELSDSDDGAAAARKRRSAAARMGARSASSPAPSPPVAVKLNGVSPAPAGDGNADGDGDVAQGEERETAAPPKVVLRVPAPPSRDPSTTLRLPSSLQQLHADGTDDAAVPVEQEPNTKKIRISASALKMSPAAVPKVKLKLPHQDNKVVPVGGGDDEAQHSEVSLCVCRQPEQQGDLYLQCDSCAGWFHPSCLGYDDDEVRRCMVLSPLIGDAVIWTCTVRVCMCICVCGRPQAKDMSPFFCIECADKPPSKRLKPVQHTAV